MGCCCSCFPSAPSPEEFLVDQPEGANSIVPGFPRHVHVDCVYKCANRRMLSIVDPNTGVPYAFVHMPEPYSFGQGATIVDAAGQPLVYLNTGELEPKHGIMSSSYKIYSPNRPLFEGQLPVPPNTPFAVPGSYLWATVVRRPFSNECVATGAHMHELGRGQLYMGFPPHSFTFARSDKTGALWCGKTADGKRNDIRAAGGVDALLLICVKFARDLADEELMDHHKHN